jgi:hypothetical protein
MSTQPTDDQKAEQPPASPTASDTPDRTAPETEELAPAEDAVLEASLESFPGSDAPAWTGSRGTP